MSRPAPAAQWPVGADLPWQLLHLFCYAAAAGLAVFALAADLGVTSRAVLALVSALLAGAWGARVGRQAAGRLCWTGEQWHWLPTSSGGQSQPAVLTALRVTVDVGDWLLVRCSVKDRRRAFWLVLASSTSEDSDHALRWTALRAALYSTVTPPEGLPGTRPAEPE